jgi:hypothetical protein
MNNMQNHKFADLKTEDIQKITDLENKISSETGEDTVLIAYSKKDG